MSVLTTAPMNVTCPSCLSSFPVDPDRVPEGGILAICSTCHRAFPVARPTGWVMDPVAMIGAPEVPEVAEPEALEEIEIQAVEVADFEVVEVAEPEVVEEVEPEVMQVADFEVVEVAEPEVVEEVEPEALVEQHPEPEPEAEFEPDPAPGIDPGAFPGAGPTGQLGGFSGSPPPLVTPPPSPSPPPASPSPPPPPSDAPAPPAEEVEAPTSARARFGFRDPANRAKRLARVLASDMITYNPARYADARRQGTLRQDFREEIEKSWEEYVEQVGEVLATTTHHFADALNEVLAQGEHLFDGPGFPS